MGHIGRKRGLLPIEAVDEVVVHRPERCGQCGALLLGQDASPYRYQVTDLPRVKAPVTEHQGQRLHCLC